MTAADELLLRNFTRDTSAKKAGERSCWYRRLVKCTRAGNPSSARELLTFSLDVGTRKKRPHIYNKMKLNSEALEDEMRYAEGQQVL